jgi:hypothetical protein
MVSSWMSVVCVASWAEEALAIAARPQLAWLAYYDNIGFFSPAG